MEILDKKSNRMSRANSGVFEHSEFPDLQRILDFLSLRNLLSNELFLLFMNLQQPHKISKIYLKNIFLSTEVLIISFETLFWISTLIFKVSTTTKTIKINKNTGKSILFNILIPPF